MLRPHVSGQAMLYPHNIFNEYVKEEKKNMNMTHYFLGVLLKKKNICLRGRSLGKCPPNVQTESYLDNINS